MTEQTEQKENHLTVYLWWPLLAGLLLAAVLAVSVGGVSLLATGKFLFAGQLLGLTFFGVLGVATVAVLG